MKHREMDDDYEHILATAGDGVRVIRCKGDIQDIIQKRHWDGWHGKYYCVERTSVERDIKNVTDEPLVWL